MCGIAGWIDWESSACGQHGVLHRMAETLACRGPDGAGTWLFGSAALAHRRLVVIDPEGGSQPMVRALGNRGTYVITYNGEVYNAPELRAELQGAGWEPHTHSDTELLLLAYIAWGPSFLTRVNGIFALAIWHTKERQLLLARDPLGVKPLFYARRGSVLVFGSELKALLAHPRVEAAVDAEGLAEVLVLGPGRTPGHGVFRGVQELRPGCYLLARDGDVRTVRYWSLVSRPHTDDLPATVARVRHLVADAVRRQLVSDVPLCALLSGGLDSSAVTAVAAEERGPGQLTTYAVSFRDMERDFRADAYQTSLDAPYARKVADALATRHREVVLDTPSLVEHLLTSLRARDLPGMADVDTSLYLFSREIRREATVALSGEAADEVFGGYRWFFERPEQSPRTYPWLRRLPERVALLSPEVRRHIRPLQYAEARYEEALAEVPRLEGEPREEARQRELFYLNLTRFLPTLLDRMDRMSMAAGLEVRVPFCDPRLVQYVWNVPWSMKTVDGVPKGLLRRAVAGWIPEEVRLRAKSPYPSTHHPGYEEACRRWLRSLLHDPSSPLLPLVDREALLDLLSRPAGRTGLPWYGQLMDLPQLWAFWIQVDAWLREYRIRLV